MARKIGRVREKSVSETSGNDGRVHVAGARYCHACASLHNTHSNNPETSDGNNNPATTTTTNSGSSTDSLSSDEDASGESSSSNPNPAVYSIPGMDSLTGNSNANSLPIPTELMVDVHTSVSQNLNHVNGNLRISGMSTARNYQALSLSTSNIRSLLYTPWPSVNADTQTSIATDTSRTFLTSLNSARSRHAISLRNLVDTPSYTWRNTLVADSEVDIILDLHCVSSISLLWPNLNPQR